uniref:Uncharacterized protein n=1 Tax=Arundo donax TaxID=35708 RepID=A0A0A9AF12_ARUDO
MRRGCGGGGRPPWSHSEPWS